MADAARRWPALDLIARAPAHSFSAEGSFSTEDWGFLAAFLDDYSPTAIVDPPSPPDDGRRAWRVFFTTADARDRARAAIDASDWGTRLENNAIDVEDEGWAARSQAKLTAIEVGRLIVAPPWDLPTTAPGTVPSHIVIEIEPSMGFGTGHHQSTRLCLRALQAIDLNGLDVIDLGTGSGVLAIAAAKLGAGAVRGIDEDPDAIEAADKNVRLNGVWGIASVAQAELTSASSTTPPADLVLANLTGALLVRYAAAVIAFAAPEGLLVLSGFTEDERVAVAHAFRDLTVVREDHEDGWIGLTLRR